MAGPRWSSVVACVVAASLVCAATACTGGDDGDVLHDARQGGDAATTDATDAFGTGVVRSDDVEYQPDVVIVEGGPESIVSGSADGLQWTIDGDAPGARDLEVGDVMLATSRVSGRVYGIEPVGDDLLVTIFPVELGEIVRNGRFDIETEVDPGAFVFQEIPEHPAAVTTPPSLVDDVDPLTEDAPDGVQPSSFGDGDGHDGGVVDAVYRPDDDTIRLPTVQLVAQQTEGAKLPPPQKGKTVYKTKVDRFDVEATAAPSVVGLSAKTALTGGVTGSLDMKFHVDRPQIRTSVFIIDGKTREQSMTLTGLRGVDVAIGLGSEGGLDSNFKTKAELPFDLSGPIVVAGVPMNVNMKFSFLVSLAFSAKNSTLMASGSYLIDGPIGYDSAKGEMISPTVKVAKPILQSIDGISIGANGLVFALSVRMQIGPGVPGLTVGPWIKVVLSVGITNGSSIGLITCRGATLNGRVAFGGGFSVNVGAPEMTAVLAKFGIKLPTYDNELASVEFVNKSATVPDVPLCTGPADS